MDVKIIKKLINAKDVVVRLHLAHWNSNGKMQIVSPSISSDFGLELKEITAEQLDKCSDLNDEEYNIIGSNDDTIETAKKVDYQDKIDIIMNAIEKPTVKYRFSNYNFDFFIYEFSPKKDSDNNEKLFAFRRTKKFKVFKKGVLGRILDGAFEELADKKLLGTDDLIDLFIYKGDITIMQHIAFERIFRLSNEFYDHASKVLNNPELQDRITNFESLRESALKNANYVKRLSKLDGTDNSTLFLRDLNETEKVVDTFKLDIEIKDNNMVYRDETQVGNFINLMQDAYYKTLIGKENGVDERR